MTVKELIELLSNLPLDAKVTAYDGDSEQSEEVSGSVYYPETNVVDLQTDDVS